MSFEIQKVYTENPYVDEMVYYTRLMSMDTVLKMEEEALKNETMESLKNGNLLISCVEGTAIFEEFKYVSVDILAKAGYKIDQMEEYLRDIKKIPQDKRKEITKLLREDFINNYEEMNPYYRALHGLPISENEEDFDYITDWLPPDGVVINIDKPIHKMNREEILILEKYGVLEDLIKEDPYKRQYMRHLGDKKIDYYSARRANRFDVLYIPEIDSDSIAKTYRDKLDANKFYVLRTIYSEAFKYNSDYYDNFIAILIVLITVVDIIARVQEFITRKEIFDIRSVQYIFKSYGIPFFEEIPLKYQISMVKNLHTLLKYKSTSKCMVDICSLFGFDNIKVFKYYLLKDRKVDINDGSYIYSVDENGNHILTDEYELKFLKLPLEDDLDEYIRNENSYIDYDEITYGDTTWDGGLDHDMVMKSILKEEFNFTRTKYISIDTMYDVAKMSAQQSYFFNFLYDNVELENLLTIQVPFIEPGKDFKLSDIFTLLTALTYYYRGVKDTIMDTHSKVLYVNGFNFKADLASLAESIAEKRVTDIYIDHEAKQLSLYGDVTIPKSGSLTLEIEGVTSEDIAEFIPDISIQTPVKIDVECFDGGVNISVDTEDEDITVFGKLYIDMDHENIILDYGSTPHAKEQLDNFKIPEVSIPSFEEMKSLYINNINVRDELIKGMNEADNKRIYNVYKDLYDALMTIELTHTYYEKDGAPTISDIPDPDTYIISGEYTHANKPENPPVKSNDISYYYAIIDGYYHKFKNGEWVFASELYYYTDSDEDATYSEFLKHVDYSLYNILAEAQLIDDSASRNQFIANVIDSILYALEQYIDTQEFQGLFSNLPIMSSEAVKQYIATVINFYKSYKVDFLGMNTIYTLDDKYDGYIHVIDDMIKKRYFQKNDFISIYDKFGKSKSKLTHDECVHLIERVYFDVKTWMVANKYDHADVAERITQIIINMIMYSIIQIDDKIANIILKKQINDSLLKFDYICVKREENEDSYYF